MTKCLLALQVFREDGEWRSEVHLGDSPEKITRAEGWMVGAGLAAKEAVEVVLVKLQTGLLRRAVADSLVVLDRADKIIPVPGTPEPTPGKES